MSEPSVTPVTPAKPATWGASRAWSDMLALLAILLPALYLTAVNWPNTYDDAFITYRYAYNLASGNGFVYNLGDWYLGTTAPLYGLVLGLLGFVFGAEAIPAISGWLSGLALALSGVALFWYGRSFQAPLTGALAGVFFVTCPVLFATFGGEMLVLTALILWAFVAYRLQRTYLAAVLLALATLTRPDGVLAAVVIGIHAVVRRRALPWRELTIFAAMLLPFVLLAWIFYGDPLPGTLDAKLAQRDSGLWPGFLDGTIAWLRGFTMQGSSRLFPGLPAAPHMIRFILFVAAGIPMLLLFYRFFLLPLAWVFCYVLAYSWLDVPFYHWYIVPLVLALMIVAACGVAGVVEIALRVARRWRGEAGLIWLQPLLVALLVVVLAPGLIAILSQHQRLALQPNAAEQLYKNAGAWLAANTSPQASVGYFEIGFVGYYGQRTMVDPLGLVTPNVAGHVAQREIFRAYEQYRPDYIVHNQDIFLEYIGVVTQQPWFQAEYQAVEQVSAPGVAPLIIYQRSVN